MEPAVDTDWQVSYLMDAALREASPILIIGMHRSGTRLFARILDRLGVFMGADQQADCESVTFMSLNEAILHQCGAFWSEPMSAHFMLAQPEIAEQLAVSTMAALDRSLASYTGNSGLSAGSVPDDLRPFGWKDPRNTFTLPVWRQIFPQLRVIHVLRHGIDVASSLARRHSAALRAATGEAVPSALTVIRDHGLGILSSRRGWTLPEALAMWEQYVEKARLESSELADRALEIRFEKLLELPEQVLPEIARFCGVSDGRLGADIRSLLLPQRGFAFRRDAGLVAFAEKERAVLERYGYRA